METGKRLRKYKRYGFNEKHSILALIKILSMDEELTLYINSEILKKAEIFAKENDTTIENLVANIIKDIASGNTI